MVIAAEAEEAARVRVVQVEIGATAWDQGRRWGMAASAVELSTVTAMKVIWATVLQHLNLIMELEVLRVTCITDNKLKEEFLES